MCPVPRHLQLRCPACRQQELCDEPVMIEHLRRLRKIRAGLVPEGDVLREVFRAMAGQIACPHCGHTGLIAETTDEDALDWPEARTCGACGRPIPAERVAALPEVELCAACQRAEEAGGPPPTEEYCSKCGAAMRLELSRGRGIQRYVMRCTHCRR